MEDRQLLAVSLQFDYSMDNGFFTSSRRTLLENDLRAIANRLGDSLASVASRSYTLTTASGSRTVTTSVPTDTLKLYVYGAPLSGDTAGQGGSYWSTDSSGRMRGQAANDFAPSISYLIFDSDGSTNWYFGASTANIPTNQTDFLAVARHELLHALGFISGQPTFSRHVQNGAFNGPNARAANGGAAVRLDGGHTARNVDSIMNSVVTTRDIRPVDWAILKDLGWDVREQPAGFYRNANLFIGGEGDGYIDMRVHPSRGVYLMRLDVMAGETLRLQTRDGTVASERGVDTYIKLFDSNGRVILTNDDSGSGSKEDFRRTFDVGGTYWVGVGTYAQREYTFTSPSTAAVSSTAFWLKATLSGPGDPEPSSIRAASSQAAAVFRNGVFTRQATLAPLQDYYRIQAEAGILYTIRTSLPASGGITGPAIITVYDAQGRRVAAMNSSLYGEASFRASTAGSYYVRVASDAGEATVELNESTATIGGGTDVSGYREDLNRLSGSEYFIRIEASAIPPAPTPATPPPAPSPGEPSVYPLFIDFGPHGLWIWSEAGGLSQIDLGNPENLAVSPAGDSVFIDYGSKGLWHWSQGGGLSQVNAADPENFAVGPNGMLYIDYGPYGMWGLSAQGGGIQQLNAADPEGFAPGPFGELYVDFGAHGIWEWSPNGAIHQINPANPEQFVVAGDGTLYIDFGPHGIWIWSRTGGMHRINAADPENFAPGGAGELYIDFGPHGLWYWTNTEGIRQVNAADPDEFLIALDGWHYLDFAEAGLWRWTSRAGYQKISGSNPERIAVRTSYARS